MLKTSASYKYDTTVFQIYLSWAKVRKQIPSQNKYLNDCDFFSFNFSTVVVVRFLKKYINYFTARYGSIFLSYPDACHQFPPNRFRVLKELSFKAKEACLRYIVKRKGKMWAPSPSHAWADLCISPSEVILAKRCCYIMVDPATPAP
jgi:hypothetical protein